MAAAVAYPVICIGAGLIGRQLSRMLAADVETHLLPARDLDTSMPGLLHDLGSHRATVIFAHGRYVNTRSFRSEYASLLASRLQPLEIAHDCIASAGLDVVPILLSSLVAGLPATTQSPSLRRLQHDYECRFMNLYSGRQGRILRLATVLAPDSQIVSGMQRLQDSFMLKYLRFAEDLWLPWTDFNAITAAVRHAMANSMPTTQAVSEPEAISLNAFLNQQTATFWQCRVPNRIMAWIWRQFGVQQDFFAMCEQFGKARRPRPHRPS